MGRRSQALEGKDRSITLILEEAMKRGGETFCRGAGHNIQEGARVSRHPEGGGGEGKRSESNVFLEGEITT